MVVVTVRGTRGGGSASVLLGLTVVAVVVLSSSVSPASALVQSRRHPPSTCSTRSTTPKTPRRSSTAAWTQSGLPIGSPATSSRGLTPTRASSRSPWASCCSAKRHRMAAMPASGRPRTARLVYPLARRLGLDPRMGLVALLFAAADLLGIAQSRIATLDVFVAVWTVLCVYLALRYVQDGWRTRWLMLAGLAGGSRAGHQVVGRARLWSPALLVVLASSSSRTWTGWGPGERRRAGRVAATRRPARRGLRRPAVRSVHGRPTCPTSWTAIPGATSWSSTARCGTST